MTTEIRRKITDKNINSGSVVVYPDELANYIKGTLKTFIITDSNGNELERYYGLGLKKLMDTAKKYKDNPWCLASRCYMRKY